MSGLRVLSLCLLHSTSTCSQEVIAIFGYLIGWFVCVCYEFQLGCGTNIYIFNCIAINNNNKRSILSGAEISVGSVNLT